MYKFNSLPREQKEKTTELTVVTKKKREECGIDLSTAWEGELLHMSCVKYFN